MNEHEDYSKRFIRAIQWKTGYRSYSIILLSVWTIICFHFMFVLYSLPLWLFILYHMKSDHLALFSQGFRKELVGLSVPSIKINIPKFTGLCILWIVMVKWVDFHRIIWLSVTLVLIWNHPIIKFTRDAYNRLCTPRPMNSPPVPQTKYELDRYYRFVVIEHQRSWLGKWTTLLLPNERPEWSDEYLQKVPSIHTFKLPPSTIKTNQNEESVKSSWQWVTQDWQIDYNRNVDKNGWEYGTWDWKSWASKSGLRIFTRRRYWIRNARLEQQAVNTRSPVSIRSTNGIDNDSCSSSVTSIDSSMASTPPSLITCLQKKSLASTNSLNSFSEHHTWLHH
ncbi:unnamed protein product [Rhizopus stolonifer]